MGKKYKVAMVILATTFVTACNWTMQNPYDQSRCEPGCEQGLICYERKCFQCVKDYLQGNTCKDFGFEGGILRCTGKGQYDTRDCFKCGDSIKNGTEQCDGTQLGPYTCATRGFDGGTLTCGKTCTHDTSGCYKCGDGVINGQELCDGSALGGYTCAGSGYDGGTIACAKCRIDFSGCYKCGDGIKNGAEQCDGIDLGMVTCLNKGYEGGKLQCTSSCAFDTTACYKCGDGKIGGPEQCDGSALGGKTCLSVGYQGGTLACGTSCKLDYASCYKCGDGKIGGPEQCDGTAFGGKTCKSMNFTDGSLKCTATCTISTTGCSTCGNEKIEGLEVCDKKQLVGMTCKSKLFLDGQLTCDASCSAFVTTGCYKVKDASGFAVGLTSSSTFPAVAYGGGVYLVVWQVDASVSYSIQAARVDSSGKVLDPNGVTVATATTSLGSPRVAFDGTNFLLVWEDTRSGTNMDIYGRQVSPAGLVLGTKDVAISTASKDQRKPAVTCQSGTCLVVWEDARTSSTGVFDGGIYGAHVDKTGKVLDPTGIVISKTTGAKEAPDVVGDGTNFLVVWKDDGSGNGDIYGARVASTGSLMDTKAILITSHSGVDDLPRVAFDGTNYFVVWAAMATVNQWDIRGARLSTAGTVLDAADIVIAASAKVEISPAIAPWKSSLIVVWGRQDSAYTLYGTRLDSLGKASTLGGVNLMAKYRDTLNPAVVSDGKEALMVWSDYNPIYPYSQVYGARLGQ